jgi:ferredoxin
MLDINPENVFSIGVDRDLCQTAATCLAYDFYELDDEAKAVLLTKNGLNSDAPDNELVTDGFVKISDLMPIPDDISVAQKKALDSALACPFNAIIVKDKDGQQLWPPLSKE